MQITTGRPERANLVKVIESVLASRRLAISQVSRKSESLYGRRSEQFIPRSFFHQVANPIFTPSLSQIFALSRVSDYRCSDWLLLFGFDPEEIPRLQILLPPYRTTLLDTSLADSDACVPWFRDKLVNSSIPTVAPLVQLLEFDSWRRIRSFSAQSGRGYRYVKVGQQDALAFPDLFPGSIVRINPKIDPSDLPHELGEASRRMFLVEHGNSYYCCHIRLTPEGGIRPVVTYNSYADIEWQLEPFKSLRGVADLEIRSLVNVETPPLAPIVRVSWSPTPLISGPKVSRLLKAARDKLGISLQDASGLSHRVAHLLDDPNYSISASSLSDYEVRDLLPRHLHKVFTLCIIYGLDLPALMATAGLVLEEAGREPIPDHFMKECRLAHPAVSVFGVREHGGASFLSHLLQLADEVPFFLRRSLDSLSGLPAPSLRDCFWIGGQHDVVHPFLENALLIIVNRHKKTPTYSPAKPIWQQPLYLLRRRDGKYFCGCCGCDSGTLVLRSYSDRFDFSERLRNRHDAEVIGQVVVIARTLP